jgi:hypothetical protein
MTPRTIGLLVSLARGILAVPLAVDAQQPPTVYRIRLFHVGLDHSPPGLDTLREQTGPRQTLLVNAKTYGKAVLHMTFEGRRDQSHASGDTYSRGFGD